VSDKRIVIDASTALKWTLRDEEPSSQADALLDDLLAGRLSVLVPTIFDYEITNVLKVATSRKRLSEDEAKMALEKFKFYALERVDFPPLQDQTFQLALKYDRSAYDSAYVALAQYLGVWLFTADRRLFNAVGSALGYVKWIGDYQFEAIPEDKSS